MASEFQRRFQRKIDDDDEDEDHEEESEKKPIKLGFTEGIFISEGKILIKFRKNRKG